MKKIITMVLSLAILVAFPINCFAEPNENGTDVSAKSYVLICIDTGEVLAKNNEYEHVSPASVTKIMSILLICEALDSGKIKLTDNVPTSQTAVDMGGSQIWLDLGETMTVDELLKAVLIASANDACTSLGEYVAGSDVGFVKMMNDKVKELGLENTNFENCTGLDDTVKNHYSCAYDLAVISKEVMKHDIVKKYSTVWLDSLRDGKTELNNTNKLVNTYNGITGLKTGTTSNAGFCLSATATRDDMNLVAVVLGSKTSEERFNGAKNLLDWGFANYCVITPKIDKNKLTDVKIKGGESKKITPIYGDNSKIVLKKGESDITYQYNIKKNIKAPVKKGDILGEIKVMSSKKEVAKIELVSPQNVKLISFSTIFKIFIKSI